jgi:hypothetical protein
MREIRQSGSEGGAMQTNGSSLPLSTLRCIIAEVIRSLIFTIEEICKCRHITKFKRRGEKWEEG